MLWQVIPTLSGIIFGFESFHFLLVLLTVGVSDHVSVKILVFYQEILQTKKKNNEKVKRQYAFSKKKTKEKKQFKCWVWENIKLIIKAESMKINLFVQNGKEKLFEWFFLSLKSKREKTNITPKIFKQTKYWNWL